MSDSSEAFFKLLKWKDDKSFPIDFGGHCHGIEANEYGALDYYRDHAMNAFAFRGDIDDVAKKDEAKIALANAIENKIPLAEPLTARTCFCRCRHCGEELQFATDGIKIWCLNSCKYPDGHPAYEVEINIPSGLMVVGNDFRKQFPVAGDFDINEIIGCAKTTYQYAKIGLAHAFVGNTCPGVYKINKESFVVGTCGGKKNPVKGSRQVASICTDLWWYSICDADEYCLRAKIEGEEKEKFKKEGGHYLEIVKCRPGVYRFKHQYHRLPDRYQESQVYTYVDWVREPDPVVDLQVTYDTTNYTAGQILNFLQKRWGYSVQRSVDQLFFVNGSGTEFHPNGWVVPSTAIDEENLEEIEIPVLDEQFRWYPFSDFSNASYAAGCAADHFYSLHERKTPYLNESFTALLFNALRCILVHGVKDTFGSNEKYNESARKQQLKAAGKALKGLAKLYPDRIPENCKPLLSKKK